MSDTTAEQSPENQAALVSSYPHLLENEWTLWYDKRQDKKPGEAQNWDSNLQALGSFNTIEDFWRYYNYVYRPSQIPLNANYHLFKSQVKPMWEDDKNKNGGKWVINIKVDRPMVDKYWENLVLAMIGETLDEDVTGAVISRRKVGDKIAIWNSNKSNEEVVIGIGKKLREQLQLPPSILLEYNFHEDSLKAGSSFQSPVRYTA